MGLMEQAEKIKEEDEIEKSLEEEEKIAISLESGRLMKKPSDKAELIQEAQEKTEIDKSTEKKKKPVMEKDRVHTGIPGLDEVMEGGLKKGTVNLVGGGSGSGKSILCMQFLVNGIEQYNENGLFVSFEENEEKIVDDFKRFNWKLKEKLKNKQLVILYYTPEQVQKVIETGVGSVRDIITNIKAKRVAFDSLTAFTLLHETELAKRKGVLKFIESIKKWDCTAMVTSEQEPDIEKHQSTIMEFEVDGVILLYNVRKGDIRERSLEVLKMRGIKHAAKIFPMKIDDNGIEIFPEETVF